MTGFSFAFWVKFSTIFFMKTGDSIWSAEKKQFQQKVLARYEQNKRDLPWRETIDPYKILVSEVMLQQTQVSRVVF